MTARQSLPDQVAAASVGIPAGRVSDELRAAIVLFASLLDEQQRRLYAGLESLQLGGDRQIEELLGLDPHTVAKGRRQLLAEDVETGRVRAVGGGRKPVEKNTRGNRCDSQADGKGNRRRSNQWREVDEKDHRKDRLAS